MSYHVDVIPNRNSPPAILFRHAKREGKRIRRTTLANLSKLPPEIVNGIRALPKGGQVYRPLDDALAIRRALPHGHVAALLGLGPVRGNEMLAMLDWLLSRQVWIEKSLARRHLEGRTLLLYDVSSSYLEGRCCSLAAFGHNRDGKKGKRQIVFGLLCAGDGCPLSVEVFPGNTGDPSTVAAQVKKIQGRFGIESIALVGDRGMVTTARLREDLSPAGLAWISTLRTDAIRKLMRSPKSGGKGEEPAPLRPGELVPDEIAEILSPDFPGERLLVCLNPRLRRERARKREELLSATEEILETIASAVCSPNARLRGRAAINRRVSRDVSRKKVDKHFLIEVTDEDIRWSRRQEKIDAEAQLDGIYIIRTSLEVSDIGAAEAVEAVEAYKSLSQVERAFRSLQTAQLALRPVFVYSEDHVRGHVFLCLLAYYLQWHLRQRLAPLLFEEEDRSGARALRKSPVEKAQASERTKAKAGRKRTADGLPVHSLRTLLADLGTLTLNQVTLPDAPEHPFPMFAKPTPLQAKVFELLGVNPTRFVASNWAG